MSSARARTRFSPAVKVTITILFITWCVDYIDRMVLSIALPYISEEFGLNATAGGVLLSAFGLAYALAHIPAGLLADRFGAKRLIGFAMLAWSFFTALCAVAWNFASMLVIRLFFGVAQASYPPASIKALTEVTTRDERMTANGIVLSSNAVGTILASLLLPPLIALTGWRWSFAIAAGLGIVLFVVVAKWLPTPESIAARRARDAEQQPTQTSDVGEPEPTLPPGGARAVLTMGRLYLFTAIAFGMGVVTWGAVSWMPTYLATERGVEAGTASILLALPPLLNAAGVIFGGRLTDRLGGRPLLIVTPAMVLCVIALLLMSASESLAGFIVWECVAMLLIGVSMTSMFSVPLKALPAAAAGTASAVISMGAQIASIVIPVTMGIVVDLVGFQVAFVVLAVGAAIAAIAAAIAPQTAASFPALPLTPTAAVTEDAR